MATANPTADDYIRLLPSELGATVYVELIIIELDDGSTAAGQVDADCGRACTQVSSTKYYRDLAVPGDGVTVKSLLNSRGRSSAGFTPYYRDYNTNVLRPAAYSDVAVNRRSIVYVEAGISAARLSFAMDHIGTHREILPSRVPR